MECYLGVGMVFQVPDQTAPEVADIRLDLRDVVPETVQLGHDDLVTARVAVAMPPANDSPDRNHDQDSDGSDYLRQDSEAVH